MATPHSTKPLILLVEDDENNAELIFDTLAQEHSVLVADSKSDVLHSAITEQPALIIINLTLPELDGYWLCRRIKADGATQSIPILLLAAEIDTEVEIRAFAAGADDILPLPLHTEVVRKHVAMQIDLKRCREEHEQLSDLDPVTGLANQQRAQPGVATRRSQ